MAYNDEPRGIGKSPAQPSEEPVGEVEVVDVRDVGGDEDTERTDGRTKDGSISHRVLVTHGTS